MKKYLKFPLYMAFTAMIGMSVTACSDDDNPENPEETGGLSVQEQALKDVITDYTDKTVIPTYCIACVLISAPKKRTEPYLPQM